jgi:hypothetical protein
MPRLESGLHGLKADSSARADDQDYRHCVDASRRTRLLTVIMRCGQPLIAISERTLITVSAIGQCPPIAGEDLAAIAPTEVPKFRTARRGS